MICVCFYLNEGYHDEDFMLQHVSAFKAPRWKLTSDLSAHWADFIRVLYVCEVFTWRWHQAMSIIGAMPPQLPLWLAVAPNEPLPPRASLQSADRAEPEGPPAHTSTQILSYKQPPPPIYPSSISAPPHLGPVSGCECVCGHVRGRYVHCQLVHTVDGLQKSFFTLGLRMTRQFLGGRRGSCVFVD